MALDRLTKIDGGGISTTSDYRVGIITATKFVGPIEGTITATDGSFSGNVTIGGTLTYEDVTNIDSVGLITARNGLIVTGVSTFQDIDVDGHTNLDNVSIAGISTFSGIIDAVNTPASIRVAQDIQHKGDADTKISFPADNTISFDTAGSTRFGLSSSGNVEIHGTQTGNNVAMLYNGSSGFGFYASSNSGVNRDFRFYSSNSNSNESLRISSNGNVNVYKDIDVDGHTNLDNVSIAGVTTASDNISIVKSSGPILELTTNTNGADSSLRLHEGTAGSTSNGGGMYYSGANNKLYITCGTTLTTERITIDRDTGNVAVAKDLDVDGHTNLDNVSIVGVTTFNGLSTNDVIRVRSADSNGNCVVNILSEGTTGNSRILFSDTAATSGDGWINYSHNDRAITFTTAGTSNERFRIESDGDVVIKTNDVALRGSGTLRINSGSTAGVLNLDGGSTNHGGEINLFGGSNGGRILFRTGQGSGQQSEKMRLDENGRLLVGTTVTSSNQSGALNVFGTDGNTAFVSIRRGSNNASGPRLAFGKSRNTTDGAASGLLSDNDILGTIHFYGNDSQGFEEGAAIAANIDGTPGSNDLPTRLTFSTTPNGSDTKQERLRITSEGQVKLTGTNTGNHMSGFGSNVGGLTIDDVGNQHTALEVSHGSNKAFLVASSNNSVYLSSYGTNNFSLEHTGGSGTRERLRIDSSGKIIVREANTNPVNDFEVRRANGGGDVAIRIGNNTGTNAGSTASLYFTTSPTQNFNTAYIQAVRDGGRLNFGYSTNDPTVTMQISTNKVGITNTSPECRSGGIDMSSNDGTSGKTFTDMRGYSNLIIRNPNTDQHGFTQLLFENGGGNSAATMFRHRLGPSHGSQQNFVGDLCLFRRTGNAGGSNNDFRESTRFCGATEQARQIWWASGNTDTSGTNRLGWHHLSAERDHPGTDAYTFFRLETGAAAYARNGMGKYTCVWTTGHASGYGIAIGHFGYYMPHGSSTIVVNEHIIHRERYSNGSYYAWSDSPNLRIINNTASGGTNAAISFRCGGRRSSGFDLGVVVGLFIDLYVPESANGDSNPRLYVAGDSESNLSGGGHGNPVSHAYMSIQSSNPNHSGQP